MKKQIKVWDLIYGWRWSGMCGDGLVLQYLLKHELGNLSMRRIKINTVVCDSLVGTFDLNRWCYNISTSGTG